MRLQGTDQKMRWAVSNCIAISRPRVSQYCKVCKGKIGVFGTIWYLNHPKFKYYCWLHLDCIPKIDAEKIMAELRRSFDELKGLNDWEDKTIRCSFCGHRKNGDQKLINLPWFSVHDSCLREAYTSLRDLYIENEPLIIARSI